MKDTSGKFTCQPASVVLNGSVVLTGSLYAFMPQRICHQINISGLFIKIGTVSVSSAYEE